MKQNVKLGRSEGQAFFPSHRMNTGGRKKKCRSHFLNLISTHPTIHLIYILYFIQEIKAALPSLSPPNNKPIEVAMIECV